MKEMTELLDQQLVALHSLMSGTKSKTTNATTAASNTMTSPVASKPLEVARVEVEEVDAIAMEFARNLEFNK